MSAMGPPAEIEMRNPEVRAADSIEKAGMSQDCVTSVRLSSAAATGATATCAPATA